MRLTTRWAQRWPRVAFAQARRATPPTAIGFQSLPPPPPIVGYPPQIYMNMLPPGGAGSDPMVSDAPSFGLEHRERRHDFHRFDPPSKTLTTTKIKDRR